MILYQLTKQLEQRTVLHTALKQANEEHLIPELMNQLHAVQTQLLLQTEEWMSNVPPVIQTDFPKSLPLASFVDDGNFVTFL